MKLLGSIKEKINSAKLKLGKKSSMVLALLLSVIVLIIFFSSFNSGDDQTYNEKSCEGKSENISDFITRTELRLENILKTIKGVGEVKVFVMANQSSEFIYASDEDIKETGEGGSKTISASKSLVFSKDGSSTEPIIKLEIYPEITGVLVVAEGADDEKRRLMILNAVSVALDIENSKIEVLAGEKSK